MKTEGHYEVVRRDTYGDVLYLACKHCSFVEGVPKHYKRGDRSGLPRYNRARARIVKHLHESHREALGS